MVTLKLEITDENQYNQLNVSLFDKGFTLDIENNQNGIGLSIEITDDDAKKLANFLLRQYDNLE